MARPQSPPTALRLPPHDLEAELAVLSACALVPERIDDVAGVLRSDHFYHGPNGIIFAVLLELRAAGEPIDIVTIGSRLREKDQLKAIGGPAYLAKVIDGTPAVGNVMKHATSVRGAARKRTLIATMQKRAAEGYGSVSEAWEIEIAREIADAAELETRSQNAIVKAWRPTPLELLKTPPAPRRWLLRHPTFRGRPCVPGSGDGFIPLAKTGVLSSRGGSGKTFVMIQLAVSIAVGIPWLGYFQVASDAIGGRVLLALAEESFEDYHHRIYPICEALKLSNDQIERVAKLVQPLPLAGEHVSLLRRSEDGSLVETETYYALRSQLRSKGYVHADDCPKRRDPLSECLPTCVQGWSLVVIDPLARWGGPDVEKDNEAATHFVETIESLIDVPGRPTILLCHHSSKASRGRDGELGADDARGVGGITDGLRWHGTITPKKGGAVFAQAKSNCSIPWDDKLELVRVDGLLRAQSDEETGAAAHEAEERTERRAAAREEAYERAIRSAERAIITALEAARMPVNTRAELVALAKGAKGIKEAAVSRLKASGRLVHMKGEGYRHVPPPPPERPADDPQESLFS